MNIAVALSRLGKKGMPILRVGEDWETNGFKKFLEDAGVPLEGTKVLKDETTSTCYLLQDNNGDHVTVFYPGAMDKKYAGPIPDEFFEETAWASSPWPANRTTAISRNSARSTTFRSYSA